MPDPERSRPDIRRRIARHRPDAPDHRRPGPPPLSETPGPSRDQPLDQIRLTVAMIERPHGVGGEFQASVTTDTPERLLKLKSVYVGDEEKPRKVLGVRPHKDRVLFRLQGITTPEQVKSLGKTPLRIPASAAAPLKPGEHFLFQLIDCVIVDESGNELGVLVDIMETGANDVYVVRPSSGGTEILLPSIPDVVLDIDIENARITVRPPEYL